MLPFRILKNTFTIWSVLLFVAEVHSQTASNDSEQPSRFRTCDVSSYCIPIRRCSSFRDGWNRRGVGITCGYGTGPYRMVCCPRVYEEEVRQTRRPSTTTPLPPPYTGNKEDCGLSQGIDWFQEHGLNDADDLEATWPWMVAIRLRNGHRSPGPWCSGFLIDRTHIVSAAHCFESTRDNERLFAAIGSDEQDLAEEYAISEIKLHEDYKLGSYYHDIAILTLAREVNVSNFVPICLPDDEVASMDLTGWGATVVGWGTEIPNGEISYTLKQLDDVPIVTNEECYEILNGLAHGFKKQFPRGITRDILCSGLTEGARDTCSGNSGGPVMILYKKRWFAVGLSSFGLSCGRPGVPNGNTRISSYLGWLRQNTENGTQNDNKYDSYPIYTDVQPR